MLHRFSIESGKKGKVNSGNLLNAISIGIITISTESFHSLYYQTENLPFRFTVHRTDYLIKGLSGFPPDSYLIVSGRPITGPADQQRAILFSPTNELVLQIFQTSVRRLLRTDITLE